jgi:hypothetical protein
MLNIIILLISVCIIIYAVNYNYIIEKLDDDNIQDNKRDDEIDIITEINNNYPQFDLKNIYMKQKEDDTEEILTSVLGKNTNQIDIMPMFVSTIPGYSKYIKNYADVNNKNKKSSLSANDVNRILSEININNSNKNKLKNTKNKNRKNKVNKKINKSTKNSLMGKLSRCYNLLDISIFKTNNKDYDYWCKSEFGRKYGLKKTVKTGCPPNNIRAICSKKYYNGYPI